MAVIPLLSRNSHLTHAGVASEAVESFPFSPAMTLCGRPGRVPVFREGYDLSDVDCKRCLAIIARNSLEDDYRKSSRTNQ